MEQKTLHLLSTYLFLKVSHYNPNSGREKLHTTWKWDQRWHELGYQNNKIHHSTVCKAHITYFIAQQYKTSVCYAAIYLTREPYVGLLSKKNYIITLGNLGRFSANRFLIFYFNWQVISFTMGRKEGNVKLLSSFKIYVMGRKQRNP